MGAVISLSAPAPAVAFIYSFPSNAQGALIATDPLEQASWTYTYSTETWSLTMPFGMQPQAGLTNGAELFPSVFGSGAIAKDISGTYQVQAQVDHLGNVLGGAWVWSGDSPTLGIDSPTTLMSGRVLGSFGGPQLWVSVDYTNPALLSLAPGNYASLSLSGDAGPCFGAISCPESIVNQWAQDYIGSVIEPGISSFQVPLASACRSDVQNAVSLGTNGPYMTAVFTPNSGLTQAAADCGVQQFDWQQVVTQLPSPSPLSLASQPTVPLASPPPFLDPAIGGYNYSPFNSYPYYCDLTGDPDCPILNSGSSLAFSDDPADPCLTGGSAAGGASCDNGTATGPLEFSTSLVGVNADGSPGPTLFNWTWESTYNGTAGGVAQIKSAFPIDAGSGTGGVSILSINGEPVPEPPMLELLGFSLVGLLFMRWSKNNQTRGLFMVSTAASHAIAKVRRRSPAAKGRFVPAIAAFFAGAVSLSLPGTADATFYSLPSTAVGGLLASDSPEEGTWTYTASTETWSLTMPFGTAPGDRATLSLNNGIGPLLATDLSGTYQIQAQVNSSGSVLGGAWVWTGDSPSLGIASPTTLMSGRILGAFSPTQLFASVDYANPALQSLAPDNDAVLSIVGNGGPCFGETTCAGGASPWAANSTGTIIEPLPTISGYQVPLATTCQSAVQNGVTLGESGAYMTAVFTPNSGLTLAQAATACGVQQFDWQQVVTQLPSPSPLSLASAPTVPLTSPPPFLDPAIGGYNYSPFNSYPYYCDLTGDPDCPILNSGSSLAFSDDPADPCLPGGSGSGCGGLTAPAGSTLEFSTSLVGVNADGSPGPTLFNWTWESTYNGTAGGVAQIKSAFPIDAGSGTGDVSILTVNGEPVPEPPMLELLGVSFLGFLFTRRVNNLSGIDKHGPLAWGIPG